MNPADLSNLRRDVTLEHQDWKRRSMLSDYIATGQWSTIWDDLSVQQTDPLAENTYVEALEDKVADASSTDPQLIVPPTRGTRNDRAERNAETRRRVMRSYWDRSSFEQLKQNLYNDRIAHGAAYLYPWADLYNTQGEALESSERFPYLIRSDPRITYPVQHNLQGRMTSVIFSKIRRWSDLEAEYGKDNPGLQAAYYQWGNSGWVGSRKLDKAEEVWYFDDTHYAVGISVHAQINSVYTYYENVLPQVMTANNAAGRIDEWLIPYQPHGMAWNPVQEVRRVTADGEYRGELDQMIPQLRVAQHIFARYLEILDKKAYPMLIPKGIINPEDIGPDAILITDNTENATVEVVDIGADFEMRAIAEDATQRSRAMGKHPSERSGQQSGSGWLTGRGGQLLMSSYNTALATSQRDIAALLSAATSTAAHYDEIFCAGTKRIEGSDMQGAYSETYNPAQLFAGDYRCEVSYGAATGLDRANLMTNMAIAKELGLASNRTLRIQSGLFPDAMAEETEIAIEQASQGMIAKLFEQYATGNADPLKRFLELIDSDKETVRSALTKVVFETQPTPQQPGAQQQAPQGVPPAAAQELGPQLASAGQSLAGVGL